MGSTNLLDFDVAIATFYSAAEALEQKKTFADGKLCFKRASKHSASPFKIDVGRVRNDSGEKLGRLARVAHKITRIFDSEWRAARALKLEARKKLYAATQSWAEGIMNAPPTSGRSKEGRSDPPVLWKARFSDCFPEAPRGSGVAKYLRPSELPRYGNAIEMLAAMRGGLESSLHFETGAHREAFDAWLSCMSTAPSLQPFQKEKIDSAKTRIKGDLLTLVFNHAGHEFTFALRANPDDMSRRALHRLHGIVSDTSKDPRNAFGNLAQLLCRYTELRVLEEVPASILAETKITLKKGGPQLRVEKGEPLPKPVQQALTAATESIALECRVLMRTVVQSVKELETAVNSQARRAWPLLALPHALAEINRAESTATRTITEDGFKDAITRTVLWQAAESDGASESVPGRPILTTYHQQPSWLERAGAFLKRGAASVKPVALALPDSVNDPSSAIRYPTSNARALALSDKLGLVPEPRGLRELAHLLFHTAADRRWADLAQSERAKIADEAAKACPQGSGGGQRGEGGGAPDTSDERAFFSALLGPVRFGGRATFDDLGDDNVPVRQTAKDGKKVESDAPRSSDGDEEITVDAEGAADDVRARGRRAEQGPHGFAVLPLAQKERMSGRPGYRQDQNVIPTASSPVQALIKVILRAVGGMPVIEAQQADPVVHGVKLVAKGVDEIAIVPLANIQPSGAVGPSTEEVSQPGVITAE